MADGAGIRADAVVTLGATIGAPIHATIDLATATVEGAVDRRAAAVEPPIDTIPACIETLGSGVAAARLGAVRRAIQTVVDMITAAVESVLRAITALIEPLLDAIAAAVGALRRRLRPDLRAAHE